MARPDGSWSGARLDDSLYRLEGLAAAVGCIAVAVETQVDACQYLNKTLHVVSMLALDELEAANEASEELCAELRQAKGIPDPFARRPRKRPG